MLSMKYLIECTYLQNLLLCAKQKRCKNLETTSSSRVNDGRNSTPGGFALLGKYTL